MKGGVSRVTSEKVLKGFLSRSTRAVDSICSRRNSPDEALQVGESGVSLGRPVPENSEITDTHTHTEYQYYYNTFFKLRMDISPSVCTDFSIFKMTVVCRYKMHLSVLIQTGQRCLCSKIFFRPLGITFTDLFVCLSSGDHRVSIAIALLRT